MGPPFGFFGYEIFLAITTNRWLSPAPNTRVQVERVMIWSLELTGTFRLWISSAFARLMMESTTDPSQ